MTTVTLNLADDIARPLAAKACDLGVPVDSLIAALLIFSDDEDVINRWRMEARAVEEARAELSAILADAQEAKVAA